MLILNAKNFMHLLIISAQIRQFALTCNPAWLLSISFYFLSCVLRARLHDKIIINIRLFSKYYSLMLWLTQAMLLQASLRFFRSPSLTFWSCFALGSPSSSGHICVDLLLLGVTGTRNNFCNLKLIKIKLFRFQRSISRQSDLAWREHY